MSRGSAGAGSRSELARIQTFLSASVKIKVFRHPDSDLLVYDYPAQLKGTQLRYYSLEFKTWRMLPSSSGAPQLKPVHGQEHEAAVEAYRISTEGQTIERATRDAAQASQQASEDAARRKEGSFTRSGAVERHRAFLSRLGLLPPGIRESSTASGRRMARCYSCRSALDSAANLECLACNWIICSCGACGCGFHS